MELNIAVITRRYAAAVAAVSFDGSATDRGCSEYRNKNTSERNLMSQKLSSHLIKDKAYIWKVCCQVCDRM